MAVYEDIIGALVGERFRVIKPLGAGAFGQVFKATHEVFGIPLRDIALKLFTKGYVSRENAGEVFKEALMLEALATGVRAKGEKINLVTVYDIGVLKDYQHIPYVAMELVDGGSLEDKLRKAGRFPLQTTIRYAREICAGLALAHDYSPPIIHRDLKPANILITGNGFIKVSDFGVAIDQYEAFIRGGGGGTVSYSPPESHGAIISNPTHDTYSMGIMMLEMITGANPVGEVMHRARESGKNVDAQSLQAQEMMAELLDPITGVAFAETFFELRESKQFQQILKTCLAMNPQARYSNARQIDAALRECQSDSMPVVKEHIETAEQKVQRLLQAARKNIEWDELDKAEKLFEEVRSIEARNPQACFGLSLVYEKQNLIEDAAREQKAGTDILRTPDGMGRLADLYERIGKKAEAGAARRLAKTISSRQRW